MRQLHLYFVFNQVCLEHLELSEFDHIADAARTAFIKQSSSGANASKLQRSVARALRRLGEQVSEEVVLDDSGFSVDIQLTGQRVVVEVDGPMHYLRPRSGRPIVDGSTRFKHRLLTALGWKVLHVPYFEWRALGSPEQQKEYLTTLIGPEHQPKYF